MRTRVLAGVALAAILAWAWAGATAAEDEAKGGDKALSPQEFVSKASEADLAEITLGKMAVERGGSPEVKKFGQRMVTDHTRSAKQLSMLATQKNLTVSKELNEKHEKLAKKLSQLQGREFDAAYSQAMAEGHKHAVNLYQAQAKEGEDPQLRAFAVKTLPVIKQHHEMARRLAAQHGAERGETDRD